jgi:hypothetical protein
MKRKLLILAVLLVLAPVAMAAGDADETSARSYQIQFKSLPDAVDLISGLLSDAGSVSLQPRLKRLVVQDRPEILDRIGAVLEDFDLPPVNVDVTVSLFIGSDRRDEEAGRHAVTGSISKEVRGITETLGDFTKWTAYDPIGSRSVTCAEGSHVTINLSDDYRVLFDVDAVQERLGKVKFGDFTLQKIIRTAEGTERYENQYTQGIVLPMGRLLVVGAARDPGSKKALFLSLQVRAR